MQKGDFIQLKIDDMSFDGNGIGHDESGITVFVSGAVAGDFAKVGVTDVKKNFAKGKAVQIITESKDRALDVCPYIDSCGGCGYGKLKYEAQLRLKEKAVRDKLTRIAGIDNPDVKEIVSSDTNRGYRNKATVSVYGNIVGFKEKKSNRVVDCKECRIQNDYTMLACDALREFLSKYNGKGIIDNMVVRITSTKEMMVVINRGKGKDGKPVKQEMKWEELALLIDEKTDHLLESFYVDDKWIAGKHTILEEVTSLDRQGLKFEISPLSFYQVNVSTMLKLYDIVREKADLTGSETILDLYCGVGTIGIFLANKAKMVYGIESVRPAVIDANRNSVINGIVNTMYRCSKAEDTELEKADVAIVDPPRSGCEKGLLDSLINSGVEKIVYVSCDPATLARDIKYIHENSSYRFVSATPVDMFPDTAHVETVALLSR